MISFQRVKLAVRLCRKRKADNTVSADVLGFWECLTDQATLLRLCL